MFVTFGVFPDFMVELIDFAFFLLKFVKGHHYIIMMKADYKDDDDFSDEDS